jgi:hypothetical protein
MARRLMKLLDRLTGFLPGGMQAFDAAVPI